VGVVVVTCDADPVQATTSMEATSPARDLTGPSQQTLKIDTVSIDLR
jgi:hypothetical protein